MTDQIINRQVMALHKCAYSIRAISRELNLSKYRVESILKEAKNTNPSSTVSSNQTILIDNQKEPDTDVCTMSEIASDSGQTVAEGGLYVDNFTPKAKVYAFSEAKKSFVESLKDGRLYSISDIKGFYINIYEYSKEYNEFVALIILLHNGNKSVFQSTYTTHLKKAEWLVEAGRNLVSQLDEEFEELMVFEVLESIISTIQNILSNQDKVKSNLGFLFLNDKSRTKPSWQQSLNQSLFFPKAKK